MISKKELETQIKRKEKMNQTFFNKIYDEIITKIKLNNLKKNTDILVSVPDKRLGFPDFDFKELLYYIINKLRNAGFHVRYIEPNTLYISWVSEEELIKKQNIQNFYYQEKQITKSLLPKY